MAKLTNKQRLFVEFYLSNGLNATDAARRAGYKGNDVTLAAVGWENLRKPQIKSQIDQRLREAAMGADEVLFRITQVAQGVDTVDVMTIEYATETDPDGTTFTRPILVADLDKIKSLGLGKMIRSIKQTRAGAIQIEWHDPQKALELLGRHHKLFTDQVEHSGSIAQTSVRIFMPDNARGDRNG